MIPFPFNSVTDCSIAKLNGEGGFPHSEIVGSKVAHTSPTLIAACHVLHRLCMPRHSPNALTSRLRVHTTNDSAGLRSGDLMPLGSAPPRFHGVVINLSLRLCRQSRPSGDDHDAATASILRTHSQCQRPLATRGPLNRCRSNGTRFFIPGYAD